jgi:hypothetical protein
MTLAPGAMIDELLEIIELEGEAHAIWDDALSNLAYGRLSAEMRDGYIKKTYKATEKHAEAQQRLRVIIDRINRLTDRE